MRSQEKAREHGRRRAIGGRLNYANVVATIALFGVLAGGGAYAASKIGAKDIAKNAVRTKHIKNRAVTEAKLARGVEGLQGPKGDPGAQGPKGDTGDPGADGTPGADTGTALLASFATGSNQLVFASVDGTSTNADESNVTLLSPNADLVARDLAMGGPPPIGGNLRTYTLRVNGADTALSCTEIASGNRSCTSPPGVAVPVPARSLLALKVQATDSGSQRALVSFRLTEH